MLIRRRFRFHVWRAIKVDRRHAAIFAFAFGFAFAFPSPSLALAFISAGGDAGSAHVALQSGATLTVSERLTFDFDTAVDAQTFRTSLAVEPPAPLRIYPAAYGKRMIVTFRQAPSTRYVFAVRAGLTAKDGTSLAAPIVFAVTTERVSTVAPEPAALARRSPYRLGILEHPYPPFLGGSDVRPEYDALAKSGASFVRIDYPGVALEPSDGTFDWTREDAIAAHLAAAGITEMPIVEQYSAPLWATGGRPYPAIWGTPERFAAYAGAVAKHVALRRIPDVARIEIFNEPNLRGWWASGDPRYSDRRGSAAATYMLAAYAAIKASAPAVTVVGPALADGGDAIDPRAYLETLYANGCRRGTCWDVLSVHDYEWARPSEPRDESSPTRFDIYRDLVAIAAEHGDAGTHVMLTEWGFSSSPGSPDAFAPSVQAALIAQGLNLALSDPAVDGVVYVNLWQPRDDFWGGTALLNPDFSEKPAALAFREFAIRVRP